ncbi:MAG: NAD(P)H-dependent oxidoreductase subunit E [Bacteroidota bacterium]|nr:NAD(P)H-dependent oxidoreductase subunit E [Bacteroidota bacterium]MDP4205435.1 NAD(P)H-dependent oxidoreductase subunit E [Bacteroidota bacterium]
MEQKNTTISFSPDSLELVNKIIKRYPEGKERSALLPILHIAQAEFGGWLSPEVMDYVADLLHLLPIEVYEVATFYSMFNLEPVGECVIEVCQTGPCMLNGAGEIIKHLEKKFNIKVGETTPDGKFTLRAVECLAACGTAPVMKVGTEYHENLTTEKVDELVNHWCKCGKMSHLNPYQE